MSNWNEPPVMYGKAESNFVTAILSHLLPGEELGELKYKPDYLYGSSLIFQSTAAKQSPKKKKRKNYRGILKGIDTKDFERYLKKGREEE